MKLSDHECILGQAAVEGRLIYDRVSVGGVGGDILRLGLVNLETGKSSLSSEFSGIAGIGPSSVFLNSILDAAGADRMFGYYVSSVDGSTSSKISFGGVDTRHIRGNVRWHPCSPAPSARSLLFWSLPSGALTYGDHNFEVVMETIVDTGTSLIGIPTSMAKRIFQMAGSDAHGYIECYKVRSLPELRVEIDGFVYKLRPEEYALKLTRFTCHIGITPTSINKIILGDTFLRSYYTIYTQDRPQGLQKQAEGTHNWIGIAKVYPLRGDGGFPKPTW